MVSLYSNSLNFKLHSANSCLQRKKFVCVFRFLYVFCLLFLVIVWTGGGKFIKPVFAQLETNPPLAKTSDISLKFEYTFAEIERSLNNAFTDLLFVDSKFEDNNQDNVIAEVYKRGDIKLSAIAEEEKIRVSIPIQINATYKFDEKIQAKFLWWEPTFELKEHQPVQFDIIVNFEVKPKLNQQMKLEAETTVSFEWITYPYVTFYYLFKFRVTTQVASKLQETLEKFAEEQVKKRLEAEIDIRKLIVDFQNETAGEPFIIDAEQHLWGVANQLRAKVGQLIVLEDKFVLQMVFNTELDLLWDEDGYQQLKIEYPEITSKRPVLRKKVRDKFVIYAPVRISTELLQDLIIGRIAREPIIIDQGKNSMRVREIYLKPATNSLIVDAYLDMINRNQTFEIIATIFATPVFVQQTGDIELKNVDYQLQSESFILSIWSAVNKERLKQLIIENVRLPVKNLAEEVKTSTEEAFDKISFSFARKLDVKLEKVIIQDVFMDRDYFVILMTFEGKASVPLENLF